MIPNQGQEQRWNPLVGRWVLVSPGRSGRPHEHRRAFAPAPEQVDVDPSCPFCPGHEQETPETVFSDAPVPDWNVRVFANRYPTVAPGEGLHDIIVETPRHWRPASRLTVQEVVRALSAAGQRMRSETSRAWTYWCLFKNEGPGSGASLTHPHWQLMALPFLPPEASARAAQAQKARDQGRNLYRDWLMDEFKTEKRIIAQNREAVLISPYAARFHFELLILPRPVAEVGAFATASEERLTAVSQLTAQAVRGLYQILAAPETGPDRQLPWNVLVHLPPADTPGLFPWHLNLLPRLGQPGGLELASGLTVNTGDPDVVAEQMRSAIKEASLDA